MDHARRVRAGSRQCTRAPGRTASRPDKALKATTPMHRPYGSAHPTKASVAHIGEVRTASLVSDFLSTALGLGCSTVRPRECLHKFRCQAAGKARGPRLYNAKRQPESCLCTDSADVVSGGGFFSGVALAELFDPSGRIDDFLLPGVKGVARRTDFHMQRLVDGRTRRKRVATTAGDKDFAVLRMDCGFHRGTFMSAQTLL